jgi:hypothetical protein
LKLVRKHSDSVIFSAESSDTLTDEDVEVDKDDEIEGIGEVFSSETILELSSVVLFEGFFQ